MYPDPALQPSIPLGNPIPKILLVDDEPVNLQVLRQILGKDHQLFFAKDGPKALEIATQELPDLVLLDVMMAGMTGLEVCQHLKQNPNTRGIPVIFVTALADKLNEAEAFRVGAVDYVTKPVSAPVVQARVKTHLSLVRVDELKKSRIDIMRTLGRAAELKDNETGMHVIRMSHYARLIALALGWSEAQSEDLFMAAPMHDVGKIGIPDGILLKNGPLNQGEWELMRQHPQMGAAIIGDHHSGLLGLARSIALNHHEKWDGSGYPQRLQGEAIPIEARIVAIADIFDALTSIRPYKRAWSIEEAVAELQRIAGHHLDPRLVDVFVGILPEVLAVRAQFLDEEAMPIMGMM